MNIVKVYNGDKLFAFGEKRAKYFKEVAEAVVEATVVSDDENKKTISYLSSVDMAIGEAVTKNKHIATGVIIGTVGTAGVVLISKFVKSRKKSYKLSKEELKQMGIKTFDYETFEI